jgi:hypothetical protein
MPDAHESEIHRSIVDLFDEYGPVFVDLANGVRDDRQALLRFYAAPLRVVAGGFNVLLPDDSTLLGPQGLGGELDRFNADGFRQSSASNLEVHELNSRAVMASTTWTRQGPGVADVSFPATYLLTLTESGWRISVVIELAK